MPNVIDRRLNPRDKNLSNRKKFIEKAKDQVKRAVQDAIAKGNIGDVEKGRIKVPVKGTDEPGVYHDPKTGHKQRVMPGNKKYLQGDAVSKPQEGGAGSGREGAPDGEGEDDFYFSLTKEEFLDFFFSDLELPDMIKKQLKKVMFTTPKRAGYSNSGNPSQFDAKATMKKALGRRIALHRPAGDEVSDIELALGAAIATGAERRIILELEEKLSLIRRRMKAVPFIDPLDIRYRAFTQQPQPASKAVMFLILDVSGSMDEQLKMMAKKFFILLSILLNKNYKEVEIVFIRHHTQAEICTEHDFFYKHESGGTVVSSALKVVNETIKSTYNPNDWNIYVAQASDGDNWSDDNAVCRAELAILLPITQYYAYLETRSAYMRHTSDLWPLMEEISGSNKNLQIKGAKDATEIWGVFRDLFVKKGA